MVPKINLMMILYVNNPANNNTNPSSKKIQVNNFKFENFLNVEEKGGESLDIVDNPFGCRSDVFILYINFMGSHHLITLCCHFSSH